MSTTLRFDISLDFGDGQVLAGWVEFPTGGRTPAEFGEIARLVAEC